MHFKDWMEMMIHYYQTWQKLNVFKINNNNLEYRKLTFLCILSQ